MKKTSNRREIAAAAQAARRREDETMWFAPKRFGYGAGLPIAWQGWALLAAYLAGVLGAMQLARLPGASGGIAPLVAIVGLTLVLTIVARRHTRGGWKWRWGRED